MPKLLLDSDDDENTTGPLGGSSNKNKLTINEDYATSYERWRRKEEMQKLKDKYGEEILSEDSVASSDADDDDDSSDSDDSSDVDATIFDEQFFKVYGALKARDPHIYDEKVRFFGDKDGDKDAKTGDLDVDEDDPKTKKKSSKGMNLLEYHVNLVKKEGGITEEDRMMEKSNFKRQRPDQQGPSYVQEMESIKKEFKTILQNDEDEDDLFKGVKKTPVQVAKSDPSGIFRGGSQDDKRIRFLANYWDKKNLDDREKFLKDYILQKKYLDPSDREDGISARRLASGKPMISELVSSSSSSAKASSSSPFAKTNANEDDVNESDIEDDKPGMQMASKVYEKAAAYHFQETDAEVIKRYPREIESVRNLTGSTNRNVKRSEIKERKAKEKKEALQRYRDLRRAEIKEKLAKLQEISGNDRLLTDRKIDIDTIVDDITNFDPTKYDDCMSKLFDEQFYDVSCNPNQINLAKPKFDFIPGIDDVDDNLNPINQDAGSSGSAEAAAAFAEEEEDIDVGVWDDDDVGDGGGDANDDGAPSTSKEKRKKKQNKTEKTPAEKKNIGIYEDLIAGEVPTRFHYRKVPANDFGLTPEELLFANDKELNAWVSLKKTSQHRTMEEERYDIKVYGRKANDYSLKKKILKSIYDPEVAEAEAEAAEGTMEENDQQDEQQQQQQQQHADHQRQSMETKHTNERNTSKHRRSGHNTDAGPRRYKNKRPRNEDRDLKQINLTADRLRSYDLPQRAIKALKGKLHRQRRQKFNRK